MKVGDKLYYPTSTTRFHIEEIIEISKFGMIHTLCDSVIILEENPTGSLDREKYEKGFFHKSGLETEFFSTYAGMLHFVKKQLKEAISTSHLELLEHREELSKLRYLSR